MRRNGFDVGMRMYREMSGAENGYESRCGNVERERWV